MSRPKKRRCPTGKYRHADELAARISLTQTQGRHNPRRRELRILPCRSCAGWHITTEE